MKPKHTPGPWHVSPATIGEEYVCAEGPKGRIELATAHRDAEYAEYYLPVSANARLLAAAPELLAMLKRVHEAGGHDGGCLDELRPTPHCLQCEIGVAIAKATEGSEK